ncbi:retrotransposon protein, putative, ty1-copia subclass, partial [Tanacetum coccineum]
SGIGVSTESNDTMNEDTPIVVASIVKEGVTPSVVDKMVEKEKISSLEDTTLPESFPSFTTPVTTTVGNAPGKSSYANVTSKPSRKKVNVRTLFTPEGNGIDVVVPVDSIRAISERFANTAYGFFLGKSSSAGLFSFQFSSMDGLDAMLEDVWVKLHGVPVTAFNEDGLSAIVTKLGTPLMLDSYTSDMCRQSWGREGHYICNVRVEHEWKPPRCMSCKVFGHIHEECPKNTGVEYRPIPKKPTASSSSNKKKGVVPTIEVSKSNPFEVLNLVDNDVELVLGLLLLLIKIEKFEELLTSEKATLVDEAGNPLKKVEYLDDYDSEDEVASIDNDMARSMASERVGFGTQSLLEQ